MLVPLYRNKKCNSLCVFWNLSNNGHGEFPVTEMLLLGPSQMLLECMCRLIHWSFRLQRPLELGVAAREAPTWSSATPQKSVTLKVAPETSALRFQQPQDSWPSFVHSTNTYWVPTRFHAQCPGDTTVNEVHIGQGSVYWEIKTIK